MKNSVSQPALIVGVMALTCFAGEPFVVPWYTIDGGGAIRSQSDDGVFTLSGTIGQPDAGVMFGSDYNLTGGFWFATQLGDCNGNGIRDLGDHRAFVDCLSGPGKVAGGACRCFDSSGDERVSLLDFAETQRAFVTD